MSTFNLTKPNAAAALAARIGHFLETSLEGLFNTYLENKATSIKAKELQALGDEKLARMGVSRAEIPAYARAVVRQKYIGL